MPSCLSAGKVARTRAGRRARFSSIHRAIPAKFMSMACPLPDGWHVAMLVVARCTSSFYNFLFPFLFLLVFFLTLLPPAVLNMFFKVQNQNKARQQPATNQSWRKKKYSLSTGGFLVPNLESVPTGKRQRRTVVFLADDQSHSNIAVVSPVRRLGETLNSTSSCRESAYPIPLEMSPL